MSKKEKKVEKPTRVFNRAFAGQDENFKRACFDAGVEPTKRQASKFRRGIGRAHKALKGAVNE
jgi:hypothetical protein